jgi:hypothetical protein
MGEGRLASRVLNGALLLARDHRVALQHEGSLLTDLASATLMRGETAHALSLANESVHVARRSANPLREVMAQIGRAWVLLRANGIAAVTEVEACLGRVLELAERHGLASYAALAHYHLATVAGRLGDQVRRQRELERAHAAFAAMGAVGWLRRIERRMQAWPSR